MNEQTLEEIKIKELTGDEPEPSLDENTLSEKDKNTDIHFEEMSEKDLIKKIEELENQSAENFDKYLRSKAEVDNILKRNRKEKEEWVKYSNEKLIKELLEVIDNLENAIVHSKNENSPDALIKGVELTLKGLKDILEKAGLRDVNAEGEDFDPCFHHAVMEENDDNVEPGKVLKELQKGYTLNERLIRPSMVIISRGRSEGE